MEDLTFRVRSYSSLPRRRGLLSIPFHPLTTVTLHDCNVVIGYVQINEFRDILHDTGPFSYVALCWYCFLPAEPTFPKQGQRRSLLVVHSLRCSVFVSSFVGQL